jgi:hypothetical protein
MCRCIDGENMLHCYNFYKQATYKVIIEYFQLIFLNTVWDFVYSFSKH